MTCECSGFELLPYYSTEWRDTGRRWINGQDIGEVVVSGFPPAPGQTTVLYLPPSNNAQIIKASIWISKLEAYEFSLPIPHVGSGLPDPRADGTWSVYFSDGSWANPGLRITASSDAADLTNGDYVVFGVIELINI